MPPDVQHGTSAALPHPDDVRAYVDYLRDLGVYDLLTKQMPRHDSRIEAWTLQHLSQRASSPGAASRAHEASPSGFVTGEGATSSPQQTSSVQAPAQARPQPPRSSGNSSPFEQSQRRSHAGTATPLQRPGAGPSIQITPPLAAPSPAAAIPLDIHPVPPAIATPQMPASTPFNELAPIPTERTAPAQKSAALEALRNFIGDCTRCPLAYAGRHSIVFADGDPNARLLFVGEGPGADEDEQGLPFVGKAGQLLNNMIGAMGLKREQVYIANIVKCRPPKNRVPEPVEANTCSQFLLRQIDIVQPEVIVALGSTAATYLLGVKQSLASLRGQWFNVRGAKCAVTYHPAFLLRDPRQKGEAWKDLQRVMTELKLKPPARA